MMIRFLLIVLVGSLLSTSSLGQSVTPAEAKGSQTAKAGFKNEDDIAAKFVSWKTDGDAQNWLRTMGYDPLDVTNVSTSKPSGEKTDVRVLVTTVKGTVSHGISIKLVSSANGFNQIDKRWLRQYAAAWRMPSEIVAALRLYVGEDPPNQPSRDPKRMYIDEFEREMQTKIVDFFTLNKEMIVSDLIEGDGPDSAKWFLVAWKNADKPKWTLKSTVETIRFFSEGGVEITRAGNLKIGRITMQRKGGDGGRETAKMLQFKLNPTQLFDAK